MKGEHNNKGISRGASLLVLLILVSSFTVFLAFAATPEGPSITYVSNTSRVAGDATLREGDAKGTITTINLDFEQQNRRWKAYVGNVTGRLTLQDVEGYAIYDWTLEADYRGTVFASRNNTIDWNSIGCANVTILESEEAAMSHVPGSDDSISSTFNATDHLWFFVSGTNVSSCPYTPMYVNGTPQAQDTDAQFQQVLVMDTNNSIMIYASRIEGGEMGYNPNFTYDFQMIIAESGNPLVTNTPYYFYIEIE
ncbi:MAG: hypothetical protein ACMXYL_02730 [Candidatus Woesearchaeota archaeon]